MAWQLHKASLRRNARILSEIHPVSKTSVMVKKFEEKLLYKEKEERNLIDETVVKANKKRYYVRKDVERETSQFMRGTTNPLINEAK